MTDPSAAPTRHAALRGVIAAAIHTWIEQDSDPPDHEDYEGADVVLEALTKHRGLLFDLLMSDLPPGVKAEIEDIEDDDA